jgi:hypothetical protein
MITFTSYFIMGKTHKMGKFPNLGIVFNYHLVQRPLFWAFPHPRVVPTLIIEPK